MRFVCSGQTGLEISTCRARCAFNFARLATMTHANPLTAMSWIHAVVRWSKIAKTFFRSGVVEPPDIEKEGGALTSRSHPYIT